MLAGTELYGVAGVLLALPLLAVGREVWDYVRDRIRLEPWPTVGLVGAGLTLPLPLPDELEPPPEPSFARPELGEPADQAT